MKKELNKQDLDKVAGGTRVDTLRRFRRQPITDEVLQELRKREHYEKPSIRRKKKLEAARKTKNNTL